MKLVCVKLNDPNTEPMIYEDVVSIDQSVLRSDTFFVFFLDGTSTSIEYRSDYLYYLDMNR